MDFALTAMHSKFQGVAANLAVLYIGLLSDRSIDQDRNALPAMRTLKELLFQRV